MEVKQALYAYDFDQTYDLLWTQHIKPEIIATILAALPNNYLFAADMNEYNYFQEKSGLCVPVCLLERYTPHNYPWAENWVDLNFEFLKFLSKTHLMDNHQLMGTEVGFSAFTYNREVQLNLGEFPKEITINLNTQELVSLTWLELAFSSPTEVGSVSKRYQRKCKIFNKRHLLVDGSKQQSITLKTDGWLINSFVSSSSSISIKENTDLILYRKLEETLEKILDQLQFTEPKIITSITLNFLFTNKLRGSDEIPPRIPQPTPIERIDDPTYYHNLYYLTTKIGLPTYSSPVYTDVPNWYYFASLIRANNNHWNNGEILEDKGKAIAVLIEGDRVDLKIWLLETISGSFFTLSFSGNDPLGSGGWDWYFYGVSAYRSKKYFFAGMVAPSTIPLDYSPRPYYVDLIDKDKFDLHDQQFATIFSKKAPYGDCLFNAVNAVSFSLDSNLKIMSTLGAVGAYISGDYLSNYLIKTSKHFLFFPRIENFYFGAFSGQQSPSPGAIYRTRTLISIVYGANLTTATVVGEQRETIKIVNQSSSTTHNQYEFYDPQPHYFVDTERLTPSIELWDTPPEGQYLLTDEQVEEIINALLANINDENPEDLVMPDSIRIKEIHAALQADKFANNPDNPEVLRIANLGYYIERIARILGISVNEDGSVRSIRQSKFIPSGEIIPAGWPIGQWGRNQGGSQEGQQGGNEDEDRDGIAYEVRSNRFAVDKFSGEASAIEPGGYVLCENFFQLLHIILDDLDKALGWQEAGANVIPSISGQLVTYEGLNQLLVELAYCQSILSRNIKGTHISSLLSQAMIYEVLASLGLPYAYKSLTVESEGKDKKIYYPALDKNAPSLTDLMFVIKENLAAIVGSHISVYPKGDDLED